MRDQEASKESEPRQISLLQAVVDMVAVAEGLVTSDDPEFGFAANNALYGININNDKRLVYDKEEGLDLVDMSK